MRDQLDRLDVARKAGKYAKMSIKLKTLLLHYIKDIQSQSQVKLLDTKYFIKDRTTIKITRSFLRGENCIQHLFEHFQRLDHTDFIADVCRTFIDMTDRFILT